MPRWKSIENRKAFKATQPVPVFSAKDREVFKALYDEVKAERSKQNKLQAALAQQQAMQEQRAKELAQKELEREMEKEMEELFGLPDAEDEKERQTPFVPEHVQRLAQKRILTTGELRALQDEHRKPIAKMEKH